MNIYSVDRIENGLVILEGDDGVCCTVHLEDLPDGIKEGSVLRLTDAGYVLDFDVKNERRNKVLSLQDKIRNKN